MKDSLIPSGLVWISKLGVVLGVYHRKVPYPNGSGCYLLILQIVKYSRNVKFSSNCKMLNIQIVNTFLMEDYKQSLNFKSEILDIKMSTQIQVETCEIKLHNCCYVTACWISVQKKFLASWDPISRPGLLTSFHLAFTLPSLGQHKF